MNRLIWCLLFLAANAAAQGYPNKPIRMIVPLVPGGNQDIVARAVAEELSKSLGQQVIVENRPGQSAIIGTQFVKSAPRRRLHAALGRGHLRARAGGGEGGGLRRRERTSPA